MLVISYRLLLKDLLKLSQFKTNISLLEKWKKKKHASRFNLM